MKRYRDTFGECATERRGSSYLDGISIFLGHGFEPKLVNFLRVVIREGGGNNMSVLDSLVTHYVVCGNQLSEMLYSINLVIVLMLTRSSMKLKLSLTIG